MAALLARRGRAGVWGRAGRENAGQVAGRAIWFKLECPTVELLPRKEGPVRGFGQNYSFSRMYFRKEVGAEKDQGR